MVVNLENSEIYKAGIINTNSRILFDRSSDIIFVERTERGVTDFFRIAKKSSGVTKANIRLATEKYIPRPKSRWDIKIAVVNKLHTSDPP